MTQYTLNENDVNPDGAVMQRLTYGRDEQVAAAVTRRREAGSVLREPLAT